ncbi:GerAB/ArcD/ProY family transporter [Scopulibacillus cellulosilyticus]|uniref:Endospore germination permease n=1 Tax=Scopulibacillus cellulosilyticus TaxID=2665665 RepID=A0ABW2PSM1_9BACL
MAYLIEKGKISTFQMGVIMYFMVGGTSTLLVPSIAAKYAGQDMWLSPVWSSLIGCLNVFIAWQLYKIYPKTTMIESSKIILGRILGFVFNFFFLFRLIYDMSIIVREYGEFIHVFLSKTPLYILMGSLILVCSFAVLGGIEVIARCTQFFLPIVILFFFLMIIFIIPDLKPENMLPVMENGLKPSLKSALFINEWFVEFIYIAFLFPLLKNKKRALSWGSISVLTVMVTMVMANFVCLFLLGDITEKYNFPVYTVASYISVADFVEHLDGIVMAIWILVGFCQLAMWFYALSLGVSQWLNLSEYRPVVLPLGLLIILFSIWIAPNFESLVASLNTAFVPYTYVIMSFYPILLLCIAYVRKWATQNKII